MRKRIQIPFTPPFHWAHFLAFIEPRSIPSLERVSGGCISRRLRDSTVKIEFYGVSNVFHIEVETRDALRLDDLISRICRFLDIPCEPNRVRKDLASSLAIPPGLRVPGSWDPFETAVRALLGQQVSVKAATTFASRLCERFGAFPTAGELADGPVPQIGLTTRRSETLRHMAIAVATGSIQLNSLEGIMKLTELPGIGRWTAEYIALRCGEPDMFPTGDLMLRTYGSAECWRPWRSYAAMAIWTRHLVV